MSFNALHSNILCRKAVHVIAVSAKAVLAFPAWRKTKGPLCKAWFSILIRTLAGQLCGHGGGDKLVLSRAARPHISGACGRCLHQGPGWVQQNKKCRAGRKQYKQQAVAMYSQLSGL